MKNEDLKSISHVRNQYLAFFTMTGKKPVSIEGEVDEEEKPKDTFKFFGSRDFDIQRPIKALRAIYNKYCTGLKM